MPPTRQHYLTAQRLWNATKSFESNPEIVVRGCDLEISAVVAVSRGNCQPYLTEEDATVERIHSSVQTLHEYLNLGHSVYGVTTGFGGSADSRTKEMGKLQIALLQLTQSGVLLESDKTGHNNPSETIPEQNSMPTSWVRATMLVRCNATARGHSAVTIKALQAILRLLRADITPVVPLRGSVSASGDLMPLAYIAGALEGNPDVVVWTGARQVNSQNNGYRNGYTNGKVNDSSNGASPAPAGRTVMAANAALEKEGIPKMVFGPKEALGLVNGTATSAALSALVMFDAHHLAVLSQAITAMTVEAMLGNSESFHPFIAQVRPHIGQIETAANILALLQGSSLARGIKGPKDRNPDGLAQDRYALRSSPQWIGPQLEDLMSAHVQVTTELNSSADNPLVDSKTQEVYYGANFQAAAVTSAMEKSRLALQMLGRLMFAQSTELIDPSLNNGLPANLAADDPSTSFTMKGVDINMAAYMAELGFLANPVSSHVQTAEMHNQSINSLAFLSARMTKKATDVVSLMAASCLYICCQALDLRALQLEFFSELQPMLKEINQTVLSRASTLSGLEKLNIDLDKQLTEAWRSSSRLDVTDRINAMGDAATLCLLHCLEFDGEMTSVSIQSWRHQIEVRATATYKAVLHRFLLNPSTETYLGVGSRALYRQIRYGLGVPFHQGLAEHPGYEENVLCGDSERPRKLVGSWISVVYQALLDGQIYDAMYNAIGDGESNCHSEG